MSNLTMPVPVMNLEEVRTQVAASNELNFDAYYPAKELKFQVEGKQAYLHTPEGAAPLTTHAAHQFAGKAGMPNKVFDWLHAHDPAKLVTILNEAWTNFSAQQREKRELLIRYRDQSNGTPLVRAVLTDRYGIMDNLALLDVLADQLPPELRGANFTGMKNNVLIDPLTGALRMQIIVPDVLSEATEKDRHGMGIVLGNSETGQGSAAFWSAFKRFFCTNQFVLNQGVLRIPHKGGNTEENRERRFEKPMNEHIRLALKNAETNFANYWNLRDTKVEDPAQVLMLAARGQGLQKSLAQRIIDEKLPGNVEEMGNTAYAVVNAMTEFARDLQDAEQSFWVQTVAGKVAQLSPRKFEALVLN